MAISSISKMIDSVRKIEPFSSGTIDHKTKRIEPFTEGTIIHKTKPIDDFLPPQKIDYPVKKIEEFPQGTPSKSNVKAIEPTTTGEISHKVKKIEPFTEGTIEHKTKRIDDFSEGEIRKKTKPIEPFTSGTVEHPVRKLEEQTAGKYVAKYKRPIQKMSPTYKYKRKDQRRVKEKTTKITNSNLSTKKKNAHPPYFTTSSKGRNIDNKMKFDLNMVMGNGSNQYGDNSIKYFDRLYSVYPQLELDGVCQYIFMVRPDLNILKNANTLLSTPVGGYHQNSSPNKDYFFKYMLSKYPNILRSLTYHMSAGGSHDFIPYLVGRTESLQLADFSLKGYKLAQPYSGFQLPYASHGLESMTGGQFDMTFRDDNEFRIHKLFQAWVYYIDGVTLNRFAPKDKYIKYNKIDYATSIYCITCKADGETIIHWSKYTGAYPTSVPNSSMSFNLRGSTDGKITIPFDYFYQEHWNPLILVDFNKNSHVVTPNKQGYIPVYRSHSLKGIGIDKAYGTEAQKEIRKHSSTTTIFRKGDPSVLGSGNALVGAPFVCKVKDRNDGKFKYVLRWKKITDLSK